MSHLPSPEFLSRRPTKPRLDRRKVQVRLTAADSSKAPLEPERKATVENEKTLASRSTNWIWICCLVVVLAAWGWVWLPRGSGTLTWFQPTYQQPFLSPVTKVLADVHNAAQDLRSTSKPSILYPTEVALQEHLTVLHAFRNDLGRIWAPGLRRAVRKKDCHTFRETITAVSTSLWSISNAGNQTFSAFEHSLSALREASGEALALGRAARDKISGEVLNSPWRKDRSQSSKSQRNEQIAQDSAIKFQTTESVMMALQTDVSTEMKRWQHGLTRIQSVLTSLEMHYDHTREVGADCSKHTISEAEGTVVKHLGLLADTNRSMAVFKEFYYSLCKCYRDVEVRFTLFCPRDLQSPSR